MVGYHVHHYVAVSLFVYLRKHVFYNQIGGQGRLIAICIFNLLHIHIQDRVITVLSCGNTIGIAYASGEASEMWIWFPPFVEG